MLLCFLFVCFNKGVKQFIREYFFEEYCALSVYLQQDLKRMTSNFAVVFLDLKMWIMCKIRSVTLPPCQTTNQPTNQKKITYHASMLKRNGLHTRGWYLIAKKLKTSFSFSPIYLNASFSLPMNIEHKTVMCIPSYNTVLNEIYYHC